MKFTTKKSELVKAVSLVGRLASTRATLPILQNIYIETDGNLLKLRATDLEQTIEDGLEGRVEEPGKITIPARLLTDYLQNNTDDQITLETNDTSITISSANHSAKIKGMAAEEYPTLPVVKVEKEVTLPAEVIQSAINQTIFAAANDDTRPILTGLLFRFQEKELMIVGTDGYRLAYTKCPLSESFTGDFILPKRALQEASRLIGEETEIRLAFFGSQARFMVGSLTLITRVLDGAFPAFEGIIPKTKKFEVRLPGAALLQSLKMASLFSRDSAYSTKIDIAGDKLKVTAISPQLGENTNQIALEKPVAEAFQVSVNAQYFIEVLSVISGDVLLALIDDKSPVVLSQPSNPNYLYLVMPLRNQ